MGLLGEAMPTNVNKIVNAVQLDSDLFNVAESIRTKKGITKDLSFPTDFIEEIDSMATVGNEQPIDDVTFVDYDGNVCYTYTAAEFMELSELPPNPSHEGLIAQGWNWTLAGAKEFVGKMGTLCIGQNYTTDDGSTRVYVRVRDWMLGIPSWVNFKATVSAGVTIDWGDGYEEKSVGTAWKQYSHTYETTGDYIIKLKCTDGTFLLGYDGSNIGAFKVNTTYTNITAKCVYRVEIGDDCTAVMRQAFQQNHNLEIISFPTTVTQIGGGGNNGNVFDECYRLKCVVLPQGSELSGATGNFSNCRALSFISYGENMSIQGAHIPAAGGGLFSIRMLTTYGITGITTNFGYQCFSLERFAVDGTYPTITQGYCRDAYRLRKLTIPASVTAINANAMPVLVVEEMHMLSETPPTLANTSNALPTFNVLPNSKIYVPYSSDHSILEAYKTATNWSTYAAYIQEEPQ